MTRRPPPPEEAEVVALTELEAGDVPAELYALTVKV